MNPQPKRHRWFRWLIAIVLFVLLVIYGLPYIAGVGLLAYLKFRDPFDSWDNLSVVPIEHSLAPIPDAGSGQSFTFGDLTFASPLTGLTSKGQSLQDGGGNVTYTAGNKAIGIIYFTSDPISDMVPSISKVLLSSYGQGIGSAYELRARIDSITPATLFSAPGKTVANSFLLYLKALGVPSSVLISHTSYVHVIEEMNDSSITAADLEIFDNNGTHNYDFLVRGLTQGEIDALIESIRLK